MVSPFPFFSGVLKKVIEAFSGCMGGCGLLTQHALWKMWLEPNTWSLHGAVQVAAEIRGKQRCNGCYHTQGKPVTRADPWDPWEDLPVGIQLWPHQTQGKLITQADPRDLWEDLPLLQLEFRFPLCVHLCFTETSLDLLARIKI